MPVAILALLVVLLISACGGGWLIRGKTAERPVQVMMFIGYFWFLTFLQLLAFALLYSVAPDYFSF